MSGGGKKAAINRLRKELQNFVKDPPPYLSVAVNEQNFFLWSYLLEGPPNTPYEGGWYWGRLKFPPEYPFKPPSILMVTPSGRFRPNTRLCLSMSDYHPESWNPSWSLSTVLTGLCSFMVESTPTTGAVETTTEEKLRLAAASLEWNKSQEEFMDTFPDIDDIVAAAELASRARPAATTAAQDAQAAADAQQHRVEQLNERVATATARPDPGEDLRGTAARSIEALREELSGISRQLDAFVERAESGALRVSSVRATSVRAEDEQLTQLMLKLDAVPLPPGDEQLRTARRELVQHVHQLSTRLTDADAAAAAHAESPEQICETRRQEGCAAYSRGEYDLAIESFTEAISEAKDSRVSALCHRQRAASLYAAGYYVRGLADTMFDDSGEVAEPQPEAVAVLDGDSGPHAAISSGHTTACACLRQLGRLSEAGAQLQLALAAEEKGAAAEAHILQETENALARAAQFVIAGQPALALDSLLPVQDRPAGTCVAAPEVTAALASIRLRLGDLDGAAGGYLKAAQQADEQPPHATSRTPAEWEREAEIVQEGIALKATGNERFKAKDFEGAVAAYEQAIAMLPMVAPLHTNLAAGLAQADGGTRQFDAVCACEAALAIDHSSLKARVRRATCLSSLGRHEEALDEMATAMEMAPGNKEVMEKLQLLELAAGIALEDEDDAMRRFGGGGVGHDDGVANAAGASAGGGGRGGAGGGGKKKKRSRTKKKKK